MTNPLCGSQGATYIYGPQKGVTPDILPVLDAGMKNYAEVTAKVIGKDNQNAAGAGAAGGLGFAFSGWRADTGNTAYSGCCPYRG